MTMPMLLMSAFLTMTACGHDGPAPVFNDAPLHEVPDRAPRERVPDPQPVIDGQPRWDPSVVDLSQGQALAIGALQRWSPRWATICTATLVAPRAVLTAAHCVVDAAGVVTEASQLRFAIGADATRPAAVFAVETVAAHAAYDLEELSAADDIAVLVLAVAATEEVPTLRPIPYACEPLAVEIGELVQTVGFGLTDPHGASAGRRWWAVQEVVDSTYFDFTVQSIGTSTLCFGDSGGPALWAPAGGTPRVIGTLSWGNAGCAGIDHFDRTDFECEFLDALMEPGPAPEPACALDGVVFDGAMLACALAFFEGMDCDTCDAVLDARVCEDAINDAEQCWIGEDCTGCDDADERGDGVSCEELSGYAYFGAGAAEALQRWLAEDPACVTGAGGP